MLVNPGRETFVNFPSAILPDKAVTVFLPEPAVPLHQKYPVVYLLGVWPKDAKAAQEVLDRSAQKAILVGVNVEEADLKDVNKIVSFFTKELIPYIDTNYPTKDEPAERAIAAQGAAGTRVLSALLARKQLFARAFAANGGIQPVSFAGSDKKSRILATGSHAELNAIWQTLQEMGRVYGSQVALKIKEGASLLGDLNLDYLFAPAEELSVVKIEGEVKPKIIFITPEEKAVVEVRAVLRNGMQYDYIPQELHIAPPYLEWNATEGILHPIAGAMAGKVKISAFVDKLRFNAKIRLKK